MITQPFCPFLGIRVFIFGFLPREEKMKMKTTADFIKMKKENEKIAMLTAYDYPSGKLAQEAG